MNTPVRPTENQHPISASEAAQSSWHNYRWVICALLFFATTINYIDRQILALLKPILDDQLKWTYEDFGKINSAFQGAYALGLLGFGWFVDRFGAKMGYAASITFWSVAAMGHALVGSVSGFLTARVVLGLGQGGNFPSAIKAVALWFPRKERALATSIFNSGTNVGAIIAPAVVPWVALHYSWQAAFVATGVAGFIWLVCWQIFYAIPEKSRRVSTVEIAMIQSDGDGPESQKIPWMKLLGCRQTWSFVIAKFLTDPVWYFFLIWLPDYFKATRGLDIKRSWVHLVTIYSIVTVLSIFGGWMTGFLARRGWTVTRARKTGMLVFAICVLPILCVAQAGNWGAVLLIGLAASAHQAWSANLYTTVSDMFPKGAVASVIGLGSMAGAIGGMLFPLLTGQLLDGFNASGNIKGGYELLFGICAGAYLVAFILNHLCAPRFEPVTLKPNLT